MVYIDDIIIFSKTPEQHVEDVKAVVALLKAVNFQINLPKSEFFCEEINVLGMKMRQGELTIDKEKTTKIMALQPPRTLR